MFVLIQWIYVVCEMVSFWNGKVFVNVCYYYMMEIFINLVLISKMIVDDWFVLGVGMVKLIVDVGGMQIIMCELELVMVGGKLY